MAFVDSGRGVSRLIQPFKHLRLVADATAITKAVRVLIVILISLVIQFFFDDDDSVGGSLRCARSRFKLLKLVEEVARNTDTTSFDISAQPAGAVRWMQVK